MDGHDELLVVRCQLGDPAAFEALVRRWHGDLRRYLHHLAGDEAEDLTQDVWLRVLRGLPRLRDPASFPAWLFTIARRRSVDRRRARRARRGGDVAAADPRPDAVNEPGLGVLDRIELRSALATLPAAEREAVVLHHLIDLPVGAVAAVQGVPLGTVKSRLHRARGRLAGRLDDPATMVGGTADRRRTAEEGRR